MKYSSAEKHEIIKMIENSNLSVRKTLREIGVNKSSYYEWYKKYLEDGVEGLNNKHKSPKQFWNVIPEAERNMIADVALTFPEKSCREIAFYVTDNHGYFVSESSIYRILREKNLISSPAFTLMSAKDKFQNPTVKINELWQTDFTYLKIIHWGWYYLSTVMDDFSRYIIAWKLCKTMTAADVKETLEIAIENTGIQNVKVIQKPRLLSDNGSCYISSSLRDFLEKNDMTHTRGKPYHPMTQGKIERYHRSMKNILLLDNYYSPTELEDTIAKWVEYYNNERYHESIGNIKPRDKYLGLDTRIIEKRRKIKKETMKKRRLQNTNLQKEKILI
jgi:putative transposase